MFRIEKSLFVAGLLVVASTQATETPVAQKSLVDKVTDTTSDVVRYVKGAVGDVGTSLQKNSLEARKILATNASKFCEYLINAGFSKEEVAKISKETLRGHSKKFYAIQTGKVLAVAATVVTLYYAYKKVSGNKTSIIKTHLQL